MLDPEDIEILQAVAGGPREFRPAAMTDQDIIAFDPIGDRILALRDEGLLRLLADPLMNYETARGRYGKLIAGPTPAGRRALAQYDPPTAEAAAIIRRRLDGLLGSRQRALAEEFEAHAERQKEDTYYGDPYVPGTREFTQRELHRRGEIVLECWFAAAEGQGKVFTSSVAVLAREDLSKAFHARAGDLFELFSKCSAQDELLSEDDFEKLRGPIRSQLEADLDYAVLIGRRPSGEGVGGGKSTAIQDRSVTIHGDVFGSVVSGERASATVSFHFPPEQRQVFEANLAELRELLAGNQRIDPVSRKQLTRTIESALAEAQSEPPNRMAIGGLLYAIATAIQTLGSIPAALGLVKAAAAALGLHLQQ